MIWIYLIDPNAKENTIVITYLEGSSGILYAEEIGLNPIIPLEVAHNIFGNQQLNTLEFYSLISRLFLSENITIFDINLETVNTALNILKNYRPQGIGGRDSFILATMHQHGIDTIVTHDKNILMLFELKRIDPVFDPPLILDIGEKFNYEGFKAKTSRNFT